MGRRGRGDDLKEEVDRYMLNEREEGTERSEKEGSVPVGRRGGGWEWEYKNKERETQLCLI